MDNFKILQKTEELVNDSKNRYKITIELAKIAKEYAYEYKDSAKTNPLKIDKPIIKGLKQMQALNSKK
jgi:DNA-directed RNA polymerase subunit K/omega